MAKLFLVLRSGEGGPHDKGWLRVPTAAGLENCTAHTPVSEGPTDLVAVVSLKVTEQADLDLGGLYPGLVVEAWPVEERLQWDYQRDWADGKASPGLKRISFLKRASPLTHQQFASHWTEQHASLARKHHPAIWRYCQNVVSQPDEGDLQIDGIAELSFRSEFDMTERMYDSYDGKQTIRADLRRFIDLASGWRVLTQEHVLMS